MRKIEHIEQQIQELSQTEFAELREWLLQRDWKSRDTQIDSDARSGKLDNLLDEAQADYRAGRAREL